MGLVTTGEEVLDLYLFQWHKHRGIEHRLRGLDLKRATFFAERADGLSSVGDTLAFCRAVEMATGTEVPASARTRGRWRWSSSGSTTTRRRLRRCVRRPAYPWVRREARSCSSSSCA